jgi:glycosyltransferase involved in cell wall biosynthesis
MRRLITFGPRNAIHIALCSGMRDDLSSRYRGELLSSQAAVTVLSNACMVVPQDKIGARNGRVTIGHLANLTKEKGILSFLELFRTCVEDGLDVQAIVAGPADDKEIAESLQIASEQFADRFTWLGPVYGLAKSAFYERLDVFVFPTEYVNEAQPLVLLEALSHGAAILATDRGCINCDHAGSPGAIFPAEAFHDGARRWIADLVTKPQSRQAVAQAAANRFDELHGESTAALVEALGRITGRLPAGGVAGC